MWSGGLLVSVAFSFNKRLDELSHFVLLMSRQSADPLKNLPNLADRPASLLHIFSAKEKIN